MSHKTYEPSKDGAKELRGLLAIKRHAYYAGMTISAECLRKRYEQLEARLNDAQWEGQVIADTVRYQMEGTLKAARERGLLKE